ncbi:hypothetical protein AAZX31_02G167900 [Glycine max]|uniref:HTH myb-type domain-containing protein n=2 Tax=Glycine subgen. Soja TaxID=1462606 RepID=I1JG49_SOYBN|nr:myb family transcription factor PHL5 isoform X1 [Glycine max]KAG5052204.1 hypothetical protein JHK87_004402 [Glycine soja]KAG5080498.1 hypothetical protein JHK86_004563 [Glycine max]KAH1060874.1 hypothetical protein GYH30_004374 [Glycine max]KAH1261907.1 Myb family transcription factor PHL5 [Glycine max]KHN35237.1 Myb family transcription factor APL [Glycine soja]|eukprot:XP_006575231.1 myb family transcription factor PHL5 isoform X1 [Glycine max]
MNENRIDCVGRTQQSYGLNGDWNSEFGNCSSQYFDVRQASNMGTCNQPLAMASGGGVEQEPHIGQNKSSSSIISRFKSPASAFYATEMCMGGFPQYDSQIGNPSLMSHSSKFNDMEFPLYQSLRQSLFMPSLANQPPPKFDLSNPLQEMLKFHLNSDQCVRSLETFNKIPCGDFPGSNFLPIEQHKLFIDDAAPISRSPSIPSKGNQGQTVSCGSFNLPSAQLSFSSQQEMLSPTGSMPTNSGNSSSNGSVVSSKTRIRWTQELHEKFVECVNRLGGAEKATPKAILRLMDSDGLTIFQVKSHLQKYRIAKFMPQPTQGKSDKRTNAENVHLDVKTGFQIREALQLQLDVQRRLHEQLEIQRKLQLRIEEQGKQLKMMFDQQQKTTDSHLITENSDRPISSKDVLVSIYEGSENSLFSSKIS